MAKEVALTPGSIVKKSNGKFVQLVEKEIDPNIVLDEIQKVKRKIEDNQRQATFIAEQGTNLEAEMAKLTELYKQLI